MVLVKHQVRHGDYWLNTQIHTAENWGVIELGGNIKVWITARFKSHCNEKDCENAIEIGDRVFIDGGRTLCEEHGIEEQKSEEGK